MAKLGIDLSKFKKVAHDKDTATLRHKDGHEFKIALSALHPSSRGDVARMPIHKMAEGGDVADYLKDAPTSSSMPSQEEQVTGQPAIQEEDVNSTPAPTQNADVIKNQVPGASDISIATPPGSMAPQTPPEATADLDQKQEPEVSEDSILPQKTALEQQAESPYAQKFAPGTMEQMEGQKALAAAEARRGVEEQAAQHAAAQQYQKLQTDAQEATKNHMTEMSNAIEDFKNGHVNPNEYIDNKDTFNKINTIVGLMAAGYGSGVQGKENPAIKYMNDQIDRDIKAQEANINNKFNLVNAYSKQYGDKMLGVEAARNLMTAKALADVKAAEAKAIGPQAKANLQIQQGVLANQLAMSTAKWGMQDTFYKMGGFDQPGKSAAAEQLIQQANMYDPKLGETMQKHYVPGVGVSAQEIPEKARDQMIKSQQGLDLLQRIRKFSEENHGLKGELSPSLRAQASSLTGELHQAIRTENGMGVFKPAGEAFEKMLTGSDPLSPIAKYTQEPKLKELETVGVNEFNRYKSMHGLHNESQVSQHYQPKVPGLKEGYELRTINGKQYQVPVKK